MPKSIWFHLGIVSDIYRPEEVDYILEMYQHIKKLHNFIKHTTL